MSNSHSHVLTFSIFDGNIPYKNVITNHTVREWESNMKQRIWRIDYKIMVIIILVLLAVNSANSSIFASAMDSDENMPEPGSESLQNSKKTSQEISYADYLLESPSLPNKGKEIKLDIQDYKASEGHVTIADNFDGRSLPVLVLSDNGYVEWHFNNETPGMYHLKVEYYTQISTSKGSAIINSLMLDGKTPYIEASTISFSRVFANDYIWETDDQSTILRSFPEDFLGNEIRPSQKEVEQWQTVDITDNQRAYNDPLQFFLSAGEHVLRFSAVREQFVLGGLTFYQKTQIKTYDQYKQDHKSNNYLNTDNVEIIIQGEVASRKSDSMIYPISDFSTPATQPSSPKFIKLNSIGGSRWQIPGQWIEYDFYAPEEGLYKIGIKARQNIMSSQPSYRKLFIDGVVPYAELSSIKTSFSNDWEMLIPGGEKDPNLLFLTKGKHTLRLEVTMGQFSDVLLHTNQLISEYSSIYRTILMLVGPSPDTIRDYDFPTLIPNELKKLNQLSSDTEILYKDFVSISDMGGQQAQVLKNLSDIALEMSENPRKIAKLFSAFSADITALGTFVSNIKHQPLEIDYLLLLSPEKHFNDVNATVFEKIGFVFSQFINSFFKDYSTLNGSGQSDITVWLGSGVTGGRDQANALNTMINNEFATQKNIHVNLQLVNIGSLLTATLANKGPDIALTVPQTDPVNYAVRGAVLNLTEFEGFQDVKKRFETSATDPLTFEGKTYGLPETQNFYMMFYRDDILTELDILPPDTWDEVVSLIPTLSNKNLYFGLPKPYEQNSVGIGTAAFATFLYQNGGQFYKDNNQFSALDSDEAITSFYQWTRFYNDYGLPAAYDYLTRFRTGEMPILITDYNFYNILSVAAPELNGRWKFGLVPGVEQADGSINRTISSTVSACMIMSKSKNPNASWEFLNWWTSADTQQGFGREIESILGSAARYQPANIEALYQIPWNTSDFDLLTSQLHFTKGIPEIPGSYMTPRYLDFAFKQAVVTKKVGYDAGQIIVDASKLISGEIKIKRREFGIEDAP